MFKLPYLPDSICTAHDGNDVFLSFHWDARDEHERDMLEKALKVAVDDYVRKQGLIAVEVGKDIHHE